MPVACPLFSQGEGGRANRTYVAAGAAADLRGFTRLGWKDEDGHGESFGGGVRQRPQGP